MRVAFSRAQLIQRLLVTLPAATLTLPPRPAAALIGEVTGAGFTQADDKSWDFTLPSEAWKLGEAAPRAEHPKKLFHVQGARSGSATLDLTVELNGARQNADLGSPQKYAESLLTSLPGATLESATTIPGSTRGSQYYYLQYTTSTGTTSIKATAKQGRTYALSVSLPAQPVAEVQAEAQSLLDSFKAFPVNIFCVTQSNGGSAPVSGSCY